MGEKQKISTFKPRRADVLFVLSWGFVRPCLIFSAAGSRCYFWDRQVADRYAQSAKEAAFLGTYLSTNPHSRCGIGWAW